MLAKKYYYLWRFKCWLKRFICFWKGHDIKWGNRYNYEPDWCDRCFMDEPNDAVTFPALWEDFLDDLPEWLYILWTKWNLR